MFSFAFNSFISVLSFFFEKWELMQLCVKFFFGALFCYCARVICLVFLLTQIHSYNLIAIANFVPRFEVVESCCGRRCDGVDGITNVGKIGSLTNSNYYYTFMTHIQLLFCFFFSHFLFCIFLSTPFFVLYFVFRVLVFFVNELFKLCL